MLHQGDDIVVRESLADDLVTTIDRELVNLGHVGLLVRPGFLLVEARELAESDRRLNRRTGNRP